MKLASPSIPNNKLETVAMIRNNGVDLDGRIQDQVAKAKKAILTESLRELHSQERLLRLALNEAEATAWQTTYPHLVFTTLAQEKVHAVAAWNARQQIVRKLDPSLALAA